MLKAKPLFFSVCVCAFACNYRKNYRKPITAAAVDYFLIFMKKIISRIAKKKNHEKEDQSGKVHSLVLGLTIQLE